jgi:hypothetical protein
LKLFFDFIGLEGEDLEEQGQAFLDHGRQEDKHAWASQQIMMYLDNQNSEFCAKRYLLGL